jgi:hypothetical protein
MAAMLLLGPLARQTPAAEVAEVALETQEPLVVLAL